jgi:hypothetical protein
MIRGLSVLRSLPGAPLRVVHRPAWAIVLAAVIALVALAPATARADAGGPWYGGVGAGPYGHFGWRGGWHGRVSGEIGWHPSGHDEGFFLGLDVTTTFGGNFWQFQTGLRLGGDIEVWHNSDLAILLVPAGLVGFGIMDWDDDGPFRDHAYFLLQPSFGVALALVDRLLHVFLRPAAFDVMFFPNYQNNGFAVHGSYFVLSGIHFTFG